MTYLESKGMLLSVGVLRNIHNFNLTHASFKFDAFTLYYKRLILIYSTILSLFQMFWDKFWIVVRSNQFNVPVASKEET